MDARTQLIGLSVGLYETAEELVEGQLNGNIPDATEIAPYLERVAATLDAVADTL